MNRLDATTRARCAELAVVPGRPFDIALRFLAPVEADRCLALEALFAVIRELPLAGSDPAPGLAQLVWWHEEIEQAPGRGSQHPVVKALLLTGGIGQLHGEGWHDYLQAIGGWLADGVITDRAELLQRLRSTAGREAALVAGTETVDGAESARLLALAARLEEARPVPAWVPLDLVARHGAGPDHQRVQSLAADLATLALDQQATPPAAGPMDEGARLVHLTLALSGRLLRRLRDDPAARLARGADRLGPGDVFFAWRRARRWPGKP